MNQAVGQLQGLRQIEAAKRFIVFRSVINQLSIGFKHPGC